MTALALALLLVVRTYEGGGVAASDLDTARRIAGAALQHAGVSAAWLVCPAGTAAWLPRPRCHEAPQPHEVLVRLASGDRVRGVDDHVLGNAVVDAGAGAGSLATLYVDRIDAMAARAGVSVGVVLGRAMAHEIGHLLLGHSRHRDRGLMRSHWSEMVLKSGFAGDWVFLPEDARAMARNLAAREQSREIEMRRPAQD